jgi:hypothetical protein
LFAAYLISDLAAGMLFTLDTQYERFTLFYYAFIAMIVCYFLSNLGLLVIMIQISSMQLKYEQLYTVAETDFESMANQTLITESIEDFNLLGSSNRH